MCRPNKINCTSIPTTVRMSVLSVPLSSFLTELLDEWIFSFIWISTSNFKVSQWLQLKPLRCQPWRPILCRPLHTRQFVSVLSDPTTLEKSRTHPTTHQRFASLLADNVLHSCHFMSLMLIFWIVDSAQWHSWLFGGTRTHCPEAHVYNTQQCRSRQ